MDFTNLPPDSKAFLAPMAGVADRAFREICRDFGAAYTVTEMVSAKGPEKPGVDDPGQRPPRRHSAVWHGATGDGAGGQAVPGI